MTRDLNNLERKVEHELGRWAGRLDCPPEKEVVETVQTAVGCELGELWLARHPDPMPATALVRRIRRAVAVTLATGGGSLRWGRSPAWGSLGAAAMLAICFGVIWYAGALSRPVGASGETELVLASVSESPLDPIQMEVLSLESQLPEDEAFPEGEGASLRELVEELDRLLEAGDPSRGASSANEPGGGGLE